ncbi:MAG: hypothetical protein ACRCYO_14120 [Bacteroidia bacterium]
MRHFICAALTLLLLDSCCKPPIATSALSDRMDMRKPSISFNCIPCKMENSFDLHPGLELGGPMGRYQTFLAYGYNWRMLGIYGQSGVSFQPKALPRAGITQTLSLSLLSPNAYIRPEIGFGAARWFSPEAPSGSYKRHPAFGGSVNLFGRQNILYPFVGVRFSFPETPVMLGLRAFKLQHESGKSAYYGGVSISIGIGRFK